MKSALYTQYQKEIVPALMKQLDLKNPMEVPKVEKVCINVGMGSYLQRLGTKDFSGVEEVVTKITGRKPVVRRARMSVSNFKLRENMPVGISVTLRGEDAYNFLDKVINIVYPRVRGFRGVKKAIFDKNGNCSFGFKEHTVFPEVELDGDARRVHGVQVTVVTNTDSQEGGKALMEAFGFPFKKLTPTQ